jgi:hypothetical protein
MTGLIVAGITGSLPVFYLIIESLLRTKPPETLDPFFSPWLLLDAALVSILAFFVFRKSRLASTFLFTYFIASKVIQTTTSGTVPSGMGGVLLAIVGLLLFTAMRATYVWHRLYRTEPSKS